MSQKKYQTTSIFLFFYCIFVISYKFLSILVHIFILIQFLSMIWRNNLKGYNVKINKKLRREKNAEKIPNQKFRGNGAKKQKKFLVASRHVNRVLPY